MALTPPNLDDRTFDELLADAKARVAQTCPGWTDGTPHDPGMVLLELFAHLTETMLYRLNRLPDKIYVELLNLIGVRVTPPAAAAARLTFSLAQPLAVPVTIPRGTAVTALRVGSGAPPVFLTDDSVELPAGARSVDVGAHHGEVIDGESVGTGTGIPGLSVQVKRPPIVSATGTGLDLVVGVEALPGELDGRAPARTKGDKTYRIWREVEDFTDVKSDECVYVVDRMAGRIWFAPALVLDPAQPGGGGAGNAPVALAAAPQAQREIVAWYMRGGGASGNVAPGVLQTLKNEIRGAKLTVTNAAPAVGGRDAESLQNVLVRGPHELRSLHRAVTARDFERLALRSSAAVVRAKAVTQAELWVHGRPGTVELLLVPDVPAERRGASHESLTTALLKEYETEAACVEISNALSERRPLATGCAVTWARYKRVSVKARVVVHETEDCPAVAARLQARLFLSVTPLPSSLRDAGWPFGRAIRASDVYQILLGDSGVKYVEDVRFQLDEVPGEVTSLTRDAFQPRTWYAGSASTLFRSMDDAEGWEPVGTFTDETVQNAAVHPGRPGLLAVTGLVGPDQKNVRVHVSLDCGESWERATQTLENIRDICWTTLGGVPTLMIATEAGLYQWTLQSGSVPLRVVVDPQHADLGFYAVTAASTTEGEVVAVAATKSGGVYLSADAGKTGSFVAVGQINQDIRVLEIQRVGPRWALWAGVFSVGDSEGVGLFRWELHGTATPPGGWKTYDKNWGGGSCYCIGFCGSQVFAGTHRRGVLWLDASRDDPSWRQPDINSGLALRDVGQNVFRPVRALAVASDQPLILAGGSAGVYRGTGGESYVACSGSTFTEKVTLPSTWLFSSGAHQVEAEHELAP